VVDSEADNTFWTKIGTEFEHEDGKASTSC
jgi:hypothetical protein